MAQNGKADPAGLWLSKTVPLLLAALAAGAAAAAGEGAGGSLTWPLIAPLMFFGAGLPVVLRWTPVEPSALKLGLFACLFSPPLLTLLNVGLGSLSTALWVVAGLQLLGLGRTWRFERLGRAGWFALALSAAVACWSFSVLLLGGWEPRLGGDVQVWNAAAADVILGGQLENPALAGEAFPAHPGFAFMIATVAAALGTSTAQAAALLSVWAVTTLPVATMLLAAPLWGEVHRVMLAPLLVLVCGSSGLGLGRALGWWEDLGPDPALGIAAGSSALALSAGALLAAAHAIRHGRRPWVGLFATSAGAATLIAPGLGACALAAPALAALLRPGVPSVRRDVPLAALAAGLPGLWLARRFGIELLPFEASTSTLALVGLAPLLLLGVYGLLDARSAEGREGKALRTLLCTAALLPALWALYAADGDAARLSTVALAPLLAGGVMRATGQPLLALLAALLVAGGLWDTAVRARSQGRLAGAPFQVRLHGGVPEPASPDESVLSGDGLLPLDIVSPPQELERALLIRRRHRGEAYRWIRENLETLGRDSVLLRSLGGVGDRGDGPVRMHLAGLYTGLPLWCDAESDLGGGSPRWQPRRDRLRGLFEAIGLYDPNTLLEVGLLGRPAVILVEEADREATFRGPYKPFRGVDIELKRLGAERVHVAGSVSVYHWSPR